MSGRLLRGHRELRFDTKADFVYRVLRENIMNGHLKPGTKLAQARIAEELQVSEIPVREAIKRLQAERLVVVTPHSGAQVTDLDAEEIEEVLAIRSVLEGFAAHLAAIYATAEDIVKLESFLEKMRQCVEENDEVSYGIVNREFHSALYAIAPYKRLSKMIEDLWYGTERSRSVFSLVPGRPNASYEEHREILDAIKRRDAGKAEELVRRHRMTVAAHLRDYLLREGEGRSSPMG